MILNYKFPVYGWVGLILVIVSWIFNWSVEGLRTHLGFFPLWLGYSITVDALAYSRKGSSLINRNLPMYVLLFFVSIPCWWIFEFFNHFTKNWFYHGSQYFTDFEFFLLASLSFSTVMPAVFDTGEFLSTFKWTKRFNGRKYFPGKLTLKLFFISGCIIAVLIIIFPFVFYPFLWLSLYLIIEPVNTWLGNRTLFSHTLTGDWSIVISLAAGSLVCGFFWEMWNYYSYPKWIYNLPGVKFLHIFEMPLPGFIGYIPFSFELYALYNLLTGTKSKLF